MEPPALFERFVSLREGLGMEIIGVAKGESVFSTLIERVRGRSVIVPLLADRDISGSGIEVDLGTRRHSSPRGPLRLRPSWSARFSLHASPTRTRHPPGPMSACVVLGRSVPMNRNDPVSTASRPLRRHGWTNLPP